MPTEPIPKAGRNGGTGRRIAAHIAVFAACLVLFLPAPAHAAPPDAGAAHSRTFLPALSRGPVADGACPSTGTTYQLIPVPPPPSDRPAARHADLNLEMRGSEKVNASLKLLDYGGNTDWGAPQLNGMFAGGRIPAFTSAYQVYDWNWGCGPDGCRAGLITQPQVTLLGLAGRPGEVLHAPTRPAEIYGGGYTALVLYAAEHRITLKYTREDNVVWGYTVQLEGVCVDPNLLELYRQADTAGRTDLPALRNGQPLGTAESTEVRAAVRDCGSYMDPRSRKDWWASAR